MKTLIRIVWIACAAGWLLIGMDPARAQGTRPDGPITEEGEIAGAPFRIDIPENWNGGLIMYAHGYQVKGSAGRYNLSMTGVGGRMGYAVAQSQYSDQGWAAREGVLDTEALRRYFVATYGATQPTIIAAQGGVWRMRASIWWLLSATTPPTLSAEFTQ